jgi:peptidoglycan hydrolase CwlO-like protein
MLGVKKIGRNILAIFSMVIAVLAALSGYLYYNYVTTMSIKDAQISSLTFENNKLKNEVENLTNQLNSLQLEKSRLESIIKNLTDQNNALSTEKARLEKEVENLTEQVNNLLLERARLEKIVNNLTAENEKLKNKILSLQNQITYLNNIIAELEKKNSVLENRVRELEDIIYLRVSTVLDKDKTVNIPANNYIILSYSTPYAGYIRVSFTATHGVYIWVGSSFTGEWYYRYPREGFAARGSFIVPVLPGVTYIYIGNPSPLLGVTVTLTIEYTY